VSEEWTREEWRFRTREFGTIPFGLRTEPSGSLLSLCDESERKDGRENSDIVVVLARELFVSRRRGAFRDRSWHMSWGTAEETKILSRSTVRS